MTTQSASGLILKLAPSERTPAGADLARIDEKTGKIEIIDPTKYSVTVTSANASSPMQFHIENTTHTSVFTQSFAFGSALPVETISSLDVPKKSGVYVLSTVPYTFVKNTSNVPFLVGGGYIVSATKKAVAGVSATGDIYLLDTGYHLAYATSGTHVVVQIKDAI